VSYLLAAEVIGGLFAAGYVILAYVAWSRRPRRRPGERRREARPPQRAWRAPVHPAGSQRVNGRPRRPHAGELHLGEHEHGERER
jgi:hypothetical protein